MHRRDARICASVIRYHFYEIQIYDTDTAPVGHLALELHSNTTSTATGQLAKSQMDVHQMHETLEVTYGVVRWLEVGQYFATAKLSNGNYEYSGSRTKGSCREGRGADFPLSLSGGRGAAYPPAP